MYKFVQEYDKDICDEMQHRMEELAELDETRREAHNRNAKLNLQVKNLYDKKSIEIKFEVGSMVLMWNARSKDKGKYGKFDPLWLDPYLIAYTHGEDSYFL